MYDEQLDASGEYYSVDYAGDSLVSNESEHIFEEAEEESLFLSEWNEQVPASKMEEDAMSMCVWPYIDNIVRLKRLDIYQCMEPKAQQASSDPLESLRIRRSENWYNVRSIFFLDQSLAFTKELCIETGNGPIRRQRVSGTFL